MAVSSLLLTLIAWTIGRNRGLRDTDEVPDAVQAAATTVTFLLALALSLAFPVLSYWPLLLLTSIYGVSGVALRPCDRSGRRRSASPAGRRRRDPGGARGGS